MEKQIIVMRHAKSRREEEGLSDHERPLNRSGERASRLMGRRIKEKLFVPELIISSDAMRARETAENVALELGYERWIRVEPQLYLCEADTFLEVIRGVDETISSILIVAHNPGVEAFGRLYLGWEGEKFPTAAYFYATFSGRWRDVSRDALQLRDFDYPKSR